MGCTESSTSVIPPYNHIPIDRLHFNDDYSIAQAVPVVAITAAPTPVYIKSALKKTPFNERGRTEKLPLFTRKLPPLTKVVSFDREVLVKARTPTPSKIWYEKASSTMPMRKHRRNDDNDYDYDDEEIPSVSSDEEQENNEHSDTESQKFTVRPPTPLRRNQTNAFRHTTVPIPSTNPMEQDEYFSPMMQQPSIHPNTYAVETPTSSSVNRIKVRRRLPDLALPQIAPIPLHRSPLHTTAVPAYQNPAQMLVVSPYRSTVQPSAFSPYQSPVHGTLSNTNTVLHEHRPTLTNGESSVQTAPYTLNRHPLGNVT